MTETAFFVDLETGAIRSRAVRSVAPGVRVRFNTFLKCTIGFVRDEVAEALQDGTNVTLVVKPALGHTDAAVALDVSASESGTGTARRYEMQALVTGDVLSGLLDGVDEAVFALQVAWGTEGAAGYGISEPLEVVIVNAYVRPGEEIPDPTGDAAWELLKDTFPQGTPDEVERTLEFDLTGGLAPDGDGSALTGITAQQVGAIAGGDSNVTLTYNNVGFRIFDLANDTSVLFNIDEDLTAERTLKLKVNDADQTIDLSGSLTVSAATTVSGTNTGDVSLAGTPNYLTIVGQVITRALINLASHVTGILPRANGGTGLSAAGATGNVLTSNGTDWVSSAPAGQSAAVNARFYVHPAQWEIFWDANTTGIVSGSGSAGGTSRLCNLLTGTTANSRAQRSGEGGGSSDVWINGPGFSQNGIDFSRQVTLGFAFTVISSSGATSDFYVRLGELAGTSGTLVNDGIGIRINNLTMTGLVHNGTALNTSATLKTLTAGSITTWVVIQSDGAGNVAFYIDGTLAATLTGGPTVSQSNNSTFAIEALNGATAAQTRVHFNQPRIRVD